MFWEILGILHPGFPSGKLRTGARVCPLPDLRVRTWRLQKGSVHRTGGCVQVDVAVSTEDLGGDL